jgi:filamentous hemagglutinin family protein
MVTIYQIFGNLIIPCLYCAYKSSSQQEHGVKMEHMTWVVCSSIALTLISPAQAQILPASDTNTQVQTLGNQSNISGGQQSGANLFHSFQQFDLSSGQTANFQSNPSILNILSRITNGSPSQINGLLQITGGNSNLYLMNPAGILFGPNASLNLPAAFTATTAQGIGLGDRWFNAWGQNNYSSLNSSPSQFAFTEASGAIVNTANLGLKPNQTLTLLGGTVVNTGILTAPGGQIAIAAIPGEKLVRITTPGSLLNLVLPLDIKIAVNSQTITPASLAQLVTGGNLSSATGISVENGTVRLIGGVGLLEQSGTAVVRNNINVNGAAGGQVDILGQTVGLIDATINAAGGQVRVGGDYQGQGTTARAQNTLVNANSRINVSAIEQGNAGEAIVWSDGTTRFFGTVLATAQSGNGGLVEVSGKENLQFNGTVDTRSALGLTGHLLLDPGTVTISTPGALSDRFILDAPNQLNEIGINNSGGSNFSVSPAQIVNLLQTTDVAISAREGILVQEPINASGNIRKSDLTLSAPRVDVNDRITLNGGNLFINSIDSSTRMADRITLFELNTNGGNITLTGPRIEIGTLNSKGGNININGPAFTNGGFSSTIDSATDATSITPGNVSFSSTINSKGVKDDLTIKAKGDVTVAENIGATSSLGSFAIPFITGTGPGANNVSLKGVNATSLNFSTAGNVTIDSPTSLNTIAFIRSRGPQGINITANGNINFPDGLLDTSQTSGSNIKLVANGGNFTFNSAFFDTSNLQIQGQSINIQGGFATARQDLTLVAPNNISLQNLSLGAQNTLSLNAGQTLTLDNVTKGGSGISPNQVSLQGNAIAITNSQLLARQDLTATAAATLTLNNNQIQAYNDLTLQSTNNLTIPNGNSLLAGRDLKLTSTSAQLNISDTGVGNPIDIRSLNDITLTAPTAITINALNQSQSIFRSGNNLKLASNGPITGNGRFISGNNFVTQTIAGSPGDFRYNPSSSSGIVSAAGDITFGNYTGNSLKVEAGGSITAGDITINAADPTLQGTDPEIALLATSPTLILRAGLTPLTQTPNVLPATTELRNAPNLLPGFTSTAATSNKATITTGAIQVATSITGSDSVILSAPNGITTGKIATNSGNIQLSANQGNITVATLNAREFSSGGGSVTVNTKGLFRATETFNFTYQNPLPDFTTSPTSILTGTSGSDLNLDGKSFSGTISLTSGGQTFVENYAPGPLSATASGTAGLILRADGSNASLVPSFRDRVFLQNQGTITDPNTGGNTGSGGNTVTQTQVPPDASSDRSRSTCKPTTAIAQKSTTRSSTNCPPTNPAPSDDSAILKILQ